MNTVLTVTEKNQVQRARVADVPAGDRARIQTVVRLADHSKMSQKDPRPAGFGERAVARQPAPGSPGGPVSPECRAGDWRHGPRQLSRHGSLALIPPKDAAHQLRPNFLGLFGALLSF